MTQQLTVRQARGRRKPPVTQEWLADEADVDQTYISLIERGLRIPSDDVRDRLAKALGIAPSRLRFAAPEPAASVKLRGDRSGHSAKSREAVAS